MLSIANISYAIILLIFGRFGENPYCYRSLPIATIYVIG